MKIDSDERILPKWFWGVLFGVLGVWFLSGGFSATFCKGNFDALNALFAGLAFLSLIVTLLYQHKELGNQVKELKNSSEALKNAAEEANKTTLTLQESSELQKAALRAGYLNAVMRLDSGKLFFLADLIHQGKSKKEDKESEVDKIISALNSALHEYDELTKKFQAKDAPKTHY